MNSLQLFRNRVAKVADSLDQVADIFFCHSHSSFLNDYFAKELNSMVAQSSYTVGGISGQLNLKLLNEEIIDYTIHLRMSSSYKPNIKWMGTSQLMTIKGTGSIEARILRMPSSAEINLFRKDIPVEIVENKTLHNGDNLFSRAPYEIIEILGVKGTVIIEALTIKDPSANLFWNFGDDLLSTYPESSSLFMSRLTTILNVVNKMGTTAPPGLYDFIFKRGDTNLKLRGIQTMLKEGIDHSFDILNEFIESENVALSAGAMAILDRLLQPEPQKIANYATGNSITI